MNPVTLASSLKDNLKALQANSEYVLSNNLWWSGGLGS